MKTAVTAAVPSRAWAEIRYRMLDALRVRGWDGARSALQRVAGRSPRLNTIRARRGGGERREQTPGPVRRHVPGSSPPGRGERFSNLGCQGSVRKGMRHRALVGTIAMLGFIALACLFAALSLSLSSPSPAYAQANSAPQFPSDTPTTLSIDENTEWYQPIGDPVKATDSDDDYLTYSLEHARTLPFTINTFTGQLQVGARLDYETGSSYTVNIIATDPSEAKDTITVTINVNNVDEDGKVSLTWTRPHVGTLIEASLADPDGSVSGVTWQWVRSNAKDGNYTDISGATSATYTTQSGDVRKYLRAVASYTDLFDSGKTARSKAAYVKEASDPNLAPDFQAHTSGGYDCSRQGWGRG